MFSYSLLSNCFLPPFHSNSLSLPPSLPLSPAHYSTVTIQLNQETDCTKLVLLQTEVPESDAERTKEGWKRHIFQRIKTVFGYGAQLL